MGSKDNEGDAVATPRDVGDVNVEASYASYGDHEEVPTPPGSTKAMFSVDTPPSSLHVALAHDHVQFAMLQGTPPKQAPGFFPVTSNGDISSPSSAPGGDGRPNKTSFFGDGRRQSEDHRYAASSPGGRLSRLSGLSKISLTFVSQKNIARDSAHELARQALSHRKISIGDVTFDNPRDSNLRQSVRRLHAYSRREAPLDYEMSASVRYKRRACQLSMDREALEWKKKRNKVVGHIDTDDIVAAHPLMTSKPKDGAPAVTLAFRVHYFVKGRGSHKKALYRKHKSVDFLCENAETVERWVHTIQELVRWQARTPPIAEKRRIKIVVNPHSGKRRAVRIWNEQVKQFFDWGNFDYVLEETSYSGHAIDMGRKFSADDGFEALVFIGGDGTLCEFMNGLLSRPEHEWREIVATTPISLISAGTQNAFGLGVGIPTVEAAVYCIMKRKMRPLDVVTAISEHEPTKVHFSYCGVGWGVAGDIAAESERYRWMGTLRYAFLKAKRTVLMPKRHTGKIKYVPMNPQPPLRKYFDIRDEGALDQFEMEDGNVYDAQLDRGSIGSNAGEMPRKSWGGVGGAMRSPASSKRYAEPLWVEESGRYLVAGVVNAAPDGVYAHPSDGNMDLIISRKGNFLEMLRFSILYLVGKELESPMLTYKKVKAVVIEQNEPENCMNNDGEVLPGPGPWRMEVVPSLFKALSEK